MTNRIIASLLLGTALSIASANFAVAQDKTVKIGALSDQSGLYADLGGPGSTLAAQMAVEDSGLTAKGWKIDVISGDHLNKPDVGVNIAKQWFDVDKVDAIVDVPNSGVALAVANVVKDKNGVLIDSAAGTSDLTNAQCTPNTVHWTFDTYMLAHGTGAALTKAGGDSWFFITADYAFGAALERDPTTAVQEAGGKVLGGVKHPLGTADFSSFLLQAQASKAKVVALANAGADTTNAIKQAHEFGLSAGGQAVLPMLAFITDIKAIGIENAAGLRFTDGFYWDRTDETRAWSKRFMDRNDGRAPTVVQAGVYTLALHFLKSMDAAKSEDGTVVVTHMKSTPVNDALWKNVRIRQDGRSLNDMYLVQVKKPGDSKGPWDLYNIVSTIPGDQAFRPESEGGCSFAAK